MSDKDKAPTTELDSRFSSAGATATSWDEARRELEKAEIYWVSTVRPDGKPHVTPLLAVWLDGALYFCTGPNERKARNLLHNPRCTFTTGCNVLEGLDVILEGVAVRVSEESQLQSIAELYESKYGWHYDVRDGVFYGEGGLAQVYMVAPTTAFGFGKGETSSQTRWRF